MSKNPAFMFPALSRRFSAAAAGLCLFATPMRGEEGSTGEDFLFLFLNPSVAQNRFTMEPQVRLAAEAGITRFTFRAGRLPRNPARAAQEQKLEWMKLFTDSDPDTRVAPRIPLLSVAGDAGLKSTIVYRSGPSRLLCWTDPAVQDAAAEAVRTAVSRYESSPWSGRIWGYHLTGRETGEWIPEYRKEGLDYSEANAQAFRQWLSKKYGTDEKLRTAWGTEKVSLAAAGVPADREGRFPLNSTPAWKRVKMFYSLPEEQNWVDYSQFVSDDNARCVRRLAATAKEACSGKKAVLVFYGYVFELPSSICGHLRAREILRDENIDYVAAPISYQPYSQRLEGGPGAPMSAVDSVPLHRKTWINEDDLHTHAQMPGAEAPEWYWDSRSPEFRIPPNAQATAGILQRNLAFAAFHHASTWWMDLYGGGWFSDPEIWKVWSGGFGKKMAAIRKTSLPYRPEVAVIVDEESRFYEKFTISGFPQIYPAARNALQGCGVPVGFYYLDDYLEGRVPPSSTTVFLNAWRLDGERLAKLQARIAERQGVVIWQYAPGYMNPGVGGPAGIEQMTGIEVEADKGKTGSVGRKMLENIKFGGGYTPEPRIVIKDPTAVPLATYLSDSAVSAAMRKRDGVRHVLVAESNWSAEFLSTLFKAVNIPRMASAPAVVQASDSAVYLYGTQEGNLEIAAPAGRTFADGLRKKTVTLKVNESRLLPLVPEPDLLAPAGE